MIYVAHKLSDERLQVLKAGVEDEVVRGQLSDENSGFQPDLTKAEIVVLQGSQISPELVEHCASVRWFHSTSAGVDKAPLDMLSARRILLSNSSGIHGKPIAEQALGMMISFTRGLHYNVRSQDQHRWDAGYKIRELTGQTLCVVGAGSIGEEIARKAKAFDMHVIGIKRHPRPLPHFDDVVGLSDLHQALAQSDFVVVLVPLTKETHHLLNERALAAMKHSAVLLNFARGSVIDEQALIHALGTGVIRGAGLDVFEEEPLPSNHPFWEMDNVLISPHTGGWTPFYNQRMVEIFLANYRAYRSQRPLPTAVNLHLGY